MHACRNACTLKLRMWCNGLVISFSWRGTLPLGASLLVFTQTIGWAMMISLFFPFIFWKPPLIISGFHFWPLLKRCSFINTTQLQHVKLILSHIKVALFVINIVNLEQLAPMKWWYFRMSIYENIMFSTVKSLCILNSKLFYFGHSWEKLIEWLADNEFNYLN